MTWNSNSLDHAIGSEAAVETAPTGQAALDQVFIMETKLCRDIVQREFHSLLRLLAACSCAAMRATPMRFLATRARLAQAGRQPSE
jgi:hypothetical protein